ncbi:MAG: hypothetical protein EA390_00270, partial [Balneolaceae bacterium]
ITATSCKNLTTESNLDDSLDPVEEVTRINGADNATITVNKGQSTYFNIDFTEINPNGVIENGPGEGWCIDWKKPIDSDGGVYENIQLYSTYNVTKWKPINYLFNIMDQLKQDDPEITFRDVQVAIWVMRGNPAFDLDTIEVTDLPSRMHSNGEPTFTREKVDYIVSVVEAGYRDFTASEGSRFVVIAETPADVQTVITVVE